MKLMFQTTNQISYGRLYTPIHPHEISMHHILLIKPSLFRPNLSLSEKRHHSDLPNITQHLPNTNMSTAPASSDTFTRSSPPSYLGNRDPGNGSRLGTFGVPKTLSVWAGWWLTYPSEKYIKMMDFVSRDHEIPTEWKVIKFRFQTTNQVCNFLCYFWKSLVFSVASR